MSALVSAFPGDALPAAWAVSLTAMLLARPIYAADGRLIDDFSLDYLNPAGQRLLGLPEQPNTAVRAHFPGATVAGTSEFCRQAFETGELLSQQATFQDHGLDYKCQAQRSGKWLVVSFADTSAQFRSAVAQALRESQAREYARAQQLAEQQRLLKQILGQVSAAIATLSSPNHHFSFFNETTKPLWPAAPAWGYR